MTYFKRRLGMEYKRIGRTVNPNKEDYWTANAFSVCTTHDKGGVTLHVLFGDMLKAREGGHIYRRQLLERPITFPSWICESSICRYFEQVVTEVAYEFSDVNYRLNKDAVVKVGYWLTRYLDGLKYGKRLRFSRVAASLEDTLKPFKWVTIDSINGDVFEPYVVQLKSKVTGEVLTEVVYKGGTTEFGLNLMEYLDYIEGLAILLENAMEKVAQKELDADALSDVITQFKDDHIMDYEDTKRHYDGGQLLPNTWFACDITAYMTNEIKNGNRDCLGPWSLYDLRDNTVSDSNEVALIETI